jgi:hypothetical protein
LTYPKNGAMPIQVISKYIYVIERKKEKPMWSIEEVWASACPWQIRKQKTSLVQSQVKTTSFMDEAILKRLSHHTYIISYP